jgi:hypothetical protein
MQVTDGHALFLSKPTKGNPRQGKDLLGHPVMMGLSLGVVPFPRGRDGHVDGSLFDGEQVAPGVEFRGLFRRRSEAFTDGIEVTPHPGLAVIQPGTGPESAL